MQTIIDYLNNMFAPLPKSKVLEGLKEELLTNMEDKYNELKREGKSENEAIGIVISEFGNIDELLSEYDIPMSEEKTSSFDELADVEVEHFLALHNRASKLIGLGVFLTILAPAMLLLFIQLEGSGWAFAGPIMGLVVLLILVAIAVGLFIYSGMIMERYEKIEKTGKFELPQHYRLSLEARKNAFQPTFTKAIVAGVILCILSPISLFITLVINESLILYGVIVLLLIVSVAVYIFIYYSRIKESYEKLLKIGEFSPKTKEQNRVVGAVAAIVWPLAIVIFLISGLVFHMWHINWIIFPITGLLFGMFNGVVAAIIKEKK